MEKLGKGCHEDSLTLWLNLGTFKHVGMRHSVTSQSWEFDSLECSWEFKKETRLGNCHQHQNLAVLVDDDDDDGDEDVFDDGD